MRLRQRSLSHPRVPASEHSAPSMRLQDERGIALIMALGGMLVLTLALAATVVPSSGSARHSTSANAGQAAYAAAEAGINNAVAVLNARYTSTTTYPGDPTLL